MDKGHPLSAWPPHSYENIYFLQERYESVVMSSQMVDQIRSIPTLIHKARSTKQLIDALEEFRHLGVAFISITEQIDTSSPLGRRCSRSFLLLPSLSGH